MSESKSRKNRNRAYALPTLFTAGTLFCGYYCLMKTVQAISLPAGMEAEAARLYDHASLAIGLAVFTDGMDGKIARLTNAVSDFGRQIDAPHLDQLCSHEEGGQAGACGPLPSHFLHIIPTRHT